MQQTSVSVVPYHAAMPTDKTPADRKVTFTMERDGSLKAQYTWKRLRFMMSDGSTVDVQVTRDDSDLRAAVLAHTGVEAIAGVVTLTPAPPAVIPAQVKAPQKRVARKN